MKLSTFSVIWAVSYIFFGIGLLCVPVQFMTPFGVALNGTGAFMTRILGSALVAYAIIFYLNRHASASDKTMHYLLLGSFIYNICDMPVVTSATLNGTMNTLGWFPVGLHLFYVISFGYFAFKKAD